MPAGCDRPPWPSSWARLLLVASGSALALVCLASRSLVATHGEPLGAGATSKPEGVAPVRRESRRRAAWVPYPTFGAVARAPETFHLRCLSFGRCEAPTSEQWLRLTSVGVDSAADFVLALS